MTKKIPNVDFSKIPGNYNGRWVVVRVGSDQHVIADGKSAVEALQNSGVAPNDLTAIVTQVPTGIPAACLAEGSDDSHD